MTEHKESLGALSKWGNELRQTFRTVAQAAGVPELDVHLLMNHSIPSVNAGYITRNSPRPAFSTGPSTANAFAPMSEQQLLPILEPGDIVVMDNLGSHKGRAVRQAIRAAKAKLFFLPAYSPDLNPIEQAFAKMKTLLRKADTRTVDDTWRTIGALLDCFTPKECANYFTNAGYASA